MNIYQQNSRDSRSFLNPDEWQKCCKVEEDGAAVQPKDCIEDWKQKSDAARWEKDKAAAEYDKANKSYNSAAAWEAKLKKCKEDAEEAHKKAIEIYEELDRFLEEVDRTKTEKTAEAIKAVLCLVKSIFDRVDDLLRVSSEESMGEIQELKHWIECNEDLDANTKMNALKCISPFEEQMKVVNGAQEDLLNKLLEILHTTNVLVTAVDKSGAKDNAGLKWQLNDLKRRISGETVYTARERKCGGDETPPQDALPCKPEIINPSKHLFPILEMNDVGGSVDSDYYSDIKTLHTDAEEKEATTKEQLEDAKKKRDNAEAHYKGLEDAIKAAEAAKPAK